MGTYKFLIIILLIVIFFIDVSESATNVDNAYLYLQKVMDKYHITFDVYTDKDTGGNHFFPSGWMGDLDDITFDDGWVDNPHSGTTCIKIIYSAIGTHRKGWAGIYWQYPERNWGTIPNVGFNLSGVQSLTFWARGERGSEKVKFFAGGIGRDYVTGEPIKPYPDSIPKISTRYIELSNKWQQYTIDLGNHDMSYIVGGFGWSTNNGHNPHGATFYIDDIQYDKSRIEELRFLNSFETTAKQEDKYLRSTAFIYDNALAMLAFMARGTQEDRRRAKLLADAFLYAMDNDRYYKDGRLRNAYMSGDLKEHSTGKARLPGWWDREDRKWYEDGFQVSTHTGNVAWSMLALLEYYELNGGSKYLSAVEKLGEWVEHNCRDTRGAGGYTGGYDGWEPNPTKLKYKATEHNIDLYVTFMRLYIITKNETWRKRADHAKIFILSMWDEKEGKFWTGTGCDGVTINKEVIPVDIQAWAILALGEESKPYRKALEYVESHHRVGDGFDFNQDRDGIWYEGTAQIAVAYHATGQKEKWQKLVSSLHSAQLESGGLPATNKDGLTTGFYLSDGKPWLYFRRAHVGATAWLILAEGGINPFIWSKAR